MPLTQLNKPRLNRQKGFTLIMSLVILTILTILGLTSIQSSRTEVAMAGNMKESDVSFQATEVGLISAELYIEETTTSKTDYNDTNGLIAEHTNEPDYFTEASWNDAQPTTFTFHSTIKVHANPQFIIKYLGDRSQNEAANDNIAGYGSQQPGKTVSNFRVTARGFGQTDRATRMIQSYYGKEF